MGGDLNGGKQDNGIPVMKAGGKTNRGRDPAGGGEAQEEQWGRVTREPSIIYIMVKSLTLYTNLTELNIKTRLTSNSEIHLLPPLNERHVPPFPALKDFFFFLRSKSNKRETRQSFKNWCLNNHVQREKGAGRDMNNSPFTLRKRQFNGSQI